MRHLRWPFAVTGILLTCAAIALFIVPGNQNEPDSSSSVAKEPKTVESAEQVSDTTDRQDQLSPADDELQWNVDTDLDDLESTLQRLREETL